MVGFDMISKRAGETANDCGNTDCSIILKKENFHRSKYRTRARCKSQNFSNIYIRLLKATQTTKRFQVAWEPALPKYSATTTKSKKWSTRTGKFGSVDLQKNSPTALQSRSNGKVLGMFVVYLHPIGCSSSPVGLCVQTVLFQSFFLCFEPIVLLQQCYRAARVRACVLYRGIVQYVGEEATL